MINIWEVRKSLQASRDRILEIVDQVAPLNTEKFHTSMEVERLEAFIEAYEELCEHDWSMSETEIIDNGDYETAVLKSKCNLCGKEKVRY